MEKLSRFRETLRRHLPRLNDQYHVGSLDLFGSYVRQEQTDDSDLDVLVEFTATPGLFAFVELENDLSDLLGVQVDLVMRNALKPRLRPHILVEVVPYNRSTSCRERPRGRSLIPRGVDSRVPPQKSRGGWGMVLGEPLSSLQPKATPRTSTP